MTKRRRDLSEFPMLTAVDPGLANFGWADFYIIKGEGLCLVRLGVITTQKDPRKGGVLVSDDNMRRVRFLVQTIRRETFFTDATVVCAETFSPPRNSSAASKVAMTWGVIATLCQRSLIQATPQQVKIAACGKKTASKEEVEFAMRKRFPLAGPMLDKIKQASREHAADALAVAHACSQSEIVRAFT